MSFNQKGLEIIPQDPKSRAESKPQDRPQEALVEFGFEFDIAEALKDWRLIQVKKRLLLEVSRIDVQIEGVLLRLPEDSPEVLEAGVEVPEESKKAEDFLTNLQEINPQLRTLLDSYPDSLYFLNQDTTYPLAFANEYGLKLLDDLALQPWEPALEKPQEDQKKYLRRQLNIQLETDEKSGTRTLVLTGHSRKTNLSYFQGDDQDNFLCTLGFDESVLRIPIHPKTQKFEGKATISGVLLLKSTEGQTPQDFKAVIQKIRASQSHPILNFSLPDPQKTKLSQTKAVGGLFVPPAAPKKWTLVGMPIFSAGVLSGAACALFLLSVVAPPLGLGLVVSALIAAGVGALIGLGFNAIRNRNYSKALNQYSDAVESHQKKAALVFSPEAQTAQAAQKRLSVSASGVTRNP